jgi:hypothetical protein
MIGIMSYWFKQDKILPGENLISLMTTMMENGVINILKLRV